MPKTIMSFALLLFDVHGRLVVCLDKCCVSSGCFLWIFAESVWEVYSASVLRNKESRVEPVFVHTVTFRKLRNRLSLPSAMAPSDQTNYLDFSAVNLRTKELGTVA